MSQLTRFGLVWQLQIKVSAVSCLSTSLREMYNGPSKSSGVFGSIILSLEDHSSLPVLSRPGPSGPLSERLSRKTREVAIGCDRHQEKKRGANEKVEKRRRVIGRGLDDISSHFLEEDY